MTGALVVLAFALLDLVIAIAVAVVLVTMLGVAVAASGWDQHSTYEEREQERALRRLAKWEKNEGARARDRARWEAHRARQAATPTRAADDDR